MTIISYNVNGIRAALKKGFLTWLQYTAPDIICLQETKANKEQLDLQCFETAGYPYHYWFSAEKKGYSGVAILSRIKPVNIVYGTGIPYMDREGRNLRVDFEDLSVMSLYLPSGTNLARLNHKLQYMTDFYDYIHALKKDIPHLIISGDYNVCHNPIDIHDPVRNAKVSGFLPVERKWIDDFIKSGFTDSFRHFNPEPHHYSWWSYRANARANNKGWRIDYHLVSKSLTPRLKSAAILPEVTHSDHCPVLVTLQ